jgi:hypothetical protein
MLIFRRKITTRVADVCPQEAWILEIDLDQPLGLTSFFEVSTRRIDPRSRPGKQRLFFLEDPSTHCPVHPPLIRDSAESGDVAVSFSVLVAWQ